MNFINNKAIILSDCGSVKQFLLYKQIYEYCNLISEFIATHIEPHQCVALEMDHNIYIPSIILSLQKLQHTFIFLPDVESEKKQTIEELKICWILSFNPGKKYVATLRLNDKNLILKKFFHNEIRTYKDIYYIIRTSGTTGQNKFVRVGNYSIESNIKCLSKIFDIKECDVIYFGTPLTFDPSMIELLLALQNGACLLITPQKTKVNPTRLYQTLFHPENGINVLQIVPSLFLRWSQVQIESILLNEKLKVLAFGGECFPKSVLSCKKSKNLRMFDLYGITEVSCWATVYEIPDEETDDVPLGQALDDTFVEVRDFSGKNIAEGEGEIYIGSKQRLCFLDGESDRNEIIFRATGDVATINKKGIFYKDRNNDVFKRLGHRIHLSQIEGLVEKETGLPNKCVWSKSQSKILIFLIIENFDEKDKIVDKVRVKLLHSLPKQCFPDYIDIIRKCPVTSHGKANKKALEAVYLDRNHKTEKSAVDILKTLICETFGVTNQQLFDLQKSTFFELGGNSILAIQILNEFRDQTGTDCPDLVTALFEKDINTCLESARLVKIRKKRSECRISDNSSIAKKIRSDVELRIAWAHNLEACVDATPLVFEHRGRTLVAVGSFSHLFVVLNAEDGTEVAKFLLPDVVEGTPGLSPCRNFLYVGCFDGCLYCLDFVNNTKKWIYSAKDRIKCTPVLCQNSTAIVFGSYDKCIHCIKTEDGSAIWTTRVDESVVCTPLVQDGKIYVATICGTCLCLSEQGEILWRYKSGSPIFGAPCIFNDMIVWPNVIGSLLVLTPHGEKNQEFRCGGHVYSSLVAWENSLIFGCHDHNLYILHSDEGVLKTRVVVSLEESLTTPCLYENQIAIAGNCGRLCLIDSDGRLLGDLRLPGQVFSAVVTHGNKLFVGCRDNNLYCVEINK